MKSDETVHNHGLATCRLLALLLSVSSASPAVCSLSSVGCCPSVIVCRLSFRRWSCVAQPSPPCAVGTDCKLMQWRGGAETSGTKRATEAKLRRRRRRMERPKWDREGEEGEGGKEQEKCSFFCLVCRVDR